MRKSFNTRLGWWLERPGWFIWCFISLLPFCCLLQTYDTDPFISTALFLLTSVLEGIGLWRLGAYMLLPASLGVTLLQYGLAGHGPNAHWHWITIQLMIHFTTAWLTRGLVKHFIEAGQTNLDMILALSKSLDSRDPYTAFHSDNVAHYAVQLAAAMKLPESVRKAVYVGGLLHDIGKIGVPEAILSKPSRLDEHEYHIIKQHPALGYDILKHIPKFKHNGVLQIVRHHHERYDGKGYPSGLKGDEIPLAARIIAVADAFDAMVSKRAYRKQDTNIEYALDEIRKGRGSQFDPNIAALFLDLVEYGQLRMPLSVTGQHAAKSNAILRRTLRGIST
ncbi:HD-GYP domain-containing protein [Paenibacillus chartarius]|uniref:HD-GYP domain-containing protein n=1 Tax=Paenibacillus chartarius TaxID=747481 RepID=A0ABV6DEI2_9BACL